MASHIPVTAQVVPISPTAGSSKSSTQCIMISGPLEITPTQFRDHYEGHLSHAAKAGHSFVIGNSRGVDERAREYLHQTCKIHPSRIKVFVTKKQHGFELRQRGFEVETKFSHHDACDAGMVAVADDIIVWIRSDEETRAIVEASGKVYRPGRISGAAKNKAAIDKKKLERRQQ